MNVSSTSKPRSALSISESPSPVEQVERSMIFFQLLRAFWG
jgi:hypothetical protein